MFAFATQALARLSARSASNPRSLTWQKQWRKWIDVHTGGPEAGPVRPRPGLHRIRRMDQTLNDPSWAYRPMR